MCHVGPHAPSAYGWAGVSQDEDAGGQHLAPKRLPIAGGLGGKSQECGGHLGDTRTVWGAEEDARVPINI